MRMPQRGVAPRGEEKFLRRARSMWAVVGERSNEPGVISPRYGNATELLPYNNSRAKGDSRRNYGVFSAYRGAIVSRYRAATSRLARCTITRDIVNFMRQSTRRHSRRAPASHLTFYLHGPVSFSRALRSRPPSPSLAALSRHALSVLSFAS